MEKINVLLLQQQQQQKNPHIMVCQTTNETRLSLVSLFDWLVVVTKIQGFYLFIYLFIFEWLKNGSIVICCSYLG